MRDLFDRLIPDRVRHEGPDASRRARVVILAAAFALALSSYIVWVQLTAGSAEVALGSALLACLCVTILVVVQRTGAWRLGAGLLCAGIFAAASAVTAATGGALAAASFYLCLVPAIATLALGARWGGAAAALSTAMLLAVEFARRNGLEFPLAIAPEVAAQSNFRGALLFELILLALAMVYDSLRVHALRDVGEAGARYRALSDHAPDVLLELDDAGVVRYASPEHLDALGWERAIDASLRDRVHSEDQEALEVGLRRAEDGGADARNPIRLQLGDGTWRWFEPSYTHYDAAGARRWIIVMRDLTERLRVEEQLRQTQKMEAVEQLAGGVAHDFNNLLMVISGYAEELASGKPGGAPRTAAKEILLAAEKGEMLTRQLIAVSRPTATRARSLQLNDVLAEIEGLLRRMAGARVKLQLDLAANLSAIRADPGHLEQVLINLTLNARDAMPRGGTLSIRTHDAGGRVICEVTDTGVGMDPETRERIFEAFFTTKHRAHGTGLGLAVVHSLVRGMGGVIEVESAVGDGTRITLRLPAAAASASDRSALAAELASLRPKPPLGGQETILVVEDREAVRRVVTLALEKAGYTILQAGDGREALELAAAYDGRIDLVLSDVVMPNLSGPEMATTLARRRPNLRFLFMSGHPEQVDAFADGLAQGPLLMKPVLPEALCGRVRDELDRPGGAPIQ